jgi:ribonuclease P protein component
MLKKTNRLTKTKDIDQVFKKGKSFFGKTVGFKIANNDLGYNRINFIVSTKISKKAVIRNRVKRQLRAIIEIEMKKMVSGKDLIIIALPPIVNLSFSEINLELQASLKKIKLYQ